MRLSFICHEFPPTGGGAASSLDRFTTVLAKRGHDIQVLTISQEKQEVRDTDNLGRQIIRYNIGGRRLLSPSLSELARSYLALRTCTWADIQRFNPNALIAYFAFPSGHALMPLRERMNIPLLVWLRGSDVPGFSDKRWGLLQYLQKILIISVLKRADILAANGRNLLSMANAFVQNRDIVNLPNGIDADCFFPAEREKCGKPLKLLFVGQWIERKRCLELLDGIALAGGQGLSLHLTMVGDGPLRKKIKDRVSKLPESVYVDLLGNIDRGEMPGLFRRHELFVHLSRAEGVSNTLLEALASGLGIIASQEAVHEVLDCESPALAVLNEVTPENLLKVFTNLIGHPERVLHMGRSAREIVSRFDWSYTADTFEKLLNSNT